MWLERFVWGYCGGTSTQEKFLLKEKMLILASVFLVGEGHKEAKQQWHFQQKAGIKKVVGLSKLKTKYEAPEAKRQLASSFDIFLADERILPSLPKLIGESDLDMHHQTPCCFGKRLSLTFWGFSSIIWAIVTSPAWKIEQVMIDSVHTRIWQIFRQCAWLGPIC